MKLKSTILAALAMVGSASAATTVSYSYYTATSSTDTSWVSPANSTSVKAVNFGGVQATFGGVIWLTSNAPGSSYNDVGGLDIRYHAPGKSWASNAPNTFYPSGPTLLTDGAYSGLQNGGVDFRLDINGLTVGQAYLVQFVFADNRVGQAGRWVQIDNYSANISANADSTLYQYGYNDGRFAVVTAHFTPGVGDTAFAFRPLENYGGGMQLNGVQILAVPEPGATILGSLGMLALLRRRR